MIHRARQTAPQLLPTAKDIMSDIDYVFRQIAAGCARVCVLLLFLYQRVARYPLNGVAYQFHLRVSRAT